MSENTETKRKPGRKKRILEPIECAVCEKEFVPKTTKVQCCSKSCGGKLGSTKAALEKGRQTRLEKYGDPNFNNREKVRRTIQEKYGEQYINTSQVPEIKQKIIDTYTERHGGMGMASKSAAKKTMDATKKKYGIEDESITNPFQIQEVKDKIKETTEKRWGGIGFASPELRDKSKKTYFDEHGEDLFTGDRRKNRAHQGLMDKYGVRSVMLLPEFKKKALDSYIEKHGGMGNARKDVKDKLERDLSIFEDLYNSGAYSLVEIEEKVGVSKSTLFDWAKRLGIKISQPNRLNETWRLMLKNRTGIEFKHEGAVYGDNVRKVDLYNEEFKVAIEINPTITHSTQPTPFFNKKVPVKYHQERAILAEQNGWNLIQVFDWDDEEDIIKLIKALCNVDQQVVYARKCELKEIDKGTATRFVNENHRQGAGALGAIIYGLVHNGELMQVMTFSKERFNKKTGEKDYELIRLCSKEGYRVIGGASRLLKAFVNSSHRPDKIKTFADYAKGQGKTYERIGMTYVGLANLNGYYANIDTGEAYKVTSVSAKFRKDYEEAGQTQKEFMNERRFFRINDAGNKIFQWERKDK